MAKRVTKGLREPTLAFYSAGRIEGRGVLVDLTLSKARVGATDRSVKVGTRVELTLMVRGDILPLPVPGVVSDVTEDGFGVCFEDLEGNLHHLLQLAVRELSGAPKRSSSSASGPRPKGSLASRRALGPGEGIPVEFHAASRQGKGHIKNLSEGGLFVGSGSIPQPGDTVRLAFRTLDGRKVGVSGLIWWTTRQVRRDRSMAPGFGVRLLHTDDAYERLISSLLD